MPVALVKRGLVSRWVFVVTAYVMALRFHCRWEVIHLVVVEVYAVDPAFPRRSVVLVAGWLWLGAGLAASALCLASAS